MGVIVFLWVSAQAGVLTMGIRGYAVSGAGTVAYDAKELENGNTLVRLMKRTTGHDVRLYLPSELTPDELMEALIKVRIAHSEGAASISIITKAPLGSVRVMDPDPFSQAILVSDLFRIAGATHEESVARIPMRRRKTPSGHLTSGELVVTGETHPALAASIARELGVSHASLGELQGLRPSKTVLLVSSAVFPVNATLLRMLGQLRCLKRAGHSVVLITPYLPYARSDKKDQPGVAVTGRLIADLIEAHGADAVGFVRAHAAQSEGFFSVPTFHINGRATIEAYLKKLGVQMVVSPDTGFQKDATLFAVELGVPVDVINKQRDFNTGETRIHDVGGLDLTGLTVVVPDDETATGGTLASAAEHLKRRGAARVIGVVTHLTGSAKKALESDALDLLVVTDTNPVSLSSPKLHVLSIAKEIARGLLPLNSRCSNELAAYALTGAS